MENLIQAIRKLAPVGEVDATVEFEGEYTYDDDDSEHSVTEHGKYTVEVKLNNKNEIESVVIRKFTNDEGESFDPVLFDSADVVLSEHLADARFEIVSVSVEPGN